MNLRKEAEDAVRRIGSAERRRIVKMWRRDESFEFGDDVPAQDRAGAMVFVEVGRYIHEDGTVRVGIGLGHLVAKRKGRIQFTLDEDGVAAGIECTNIQHMVLLTPEQASRLAEAIEVAGQQLEDE